MLLPTNQLRETNVLRFVIPRLEENAFVSRYQFERRGVYFLTVNIVTRLTKEELVAKTLR